MVPRQRVKDFFGREEQLEQVKSFFKDEPEQPRILVLHALGGQGKSQIALKYCEEAREHCRGVFWINSSSQSTLTQSLVSIARELDAATTEALSDDDAKVNFALRTLEQWDDRWLMVFDNCDDPATFSAVGRFLPQSISSANTTWMDADFFRRQRRHPLHQSPSRPGGIGSYYQDPAYAR